MERQYKYGNYKGYKINRHMPSDKLEIETQYEEGYTIKRLITPLDENLLVMFFLVNNLEDNIEDGCELKKIPKEILELATNVRERFNYVLVKMYGNEPLEDFYNFGQQLYRSRLDD